MRAAIYCRISLDRKVQTGEHAGEFTMLGVQRQEQDCRALCVRNEWEVVEVYVDNDVSATSGKERPAYTRMIDALRAGSIDAIVCWHPDRLYRRTTDLEQLVDVVERSKAPIATVNAGSIDLTSPSGRLVARLLGATARYEVEHKTERWQRGVQQRLEAGIPFGGGPRLFGYTREGEVCEQEALELRRAAAALIVHGESLASIARDMTARGFTTTRGNPWTPKAVRQTLMNPRLAGWVTANGKLIARSSWTPILTQREHERLLTRLKGKGGAGRPRPRVASLLGIAHCGECGTRLITGRRSTPSSVRTYRCPSPAPGKPGAGCVEVLAEYLEAFVESYAKARLQDAQVAGWPTAAADRAALLAVVVERVDVVKARRRAPGVLTFDVGRVVVVPA